MAGKSQLKKQHPATFGSAAHVLLTGGSAGGIGTLLNIDWARDQFPSSTVVKGAPMGGWFVPGDAPDQAHTWNPPSKWPDWSKGKVAPLAGRAYDSLTSFIHFTYSLLFYSSSLF